MLLPRNGQTIVNWTLSVLFYTKQRCCDCTAKCQPTWGGATKTGWRLHTSLCLHLMTLFTYWTHKEKIRGVKRKNNSVSSSKQTSCTQTVMVGSLDATSNYLHIRIFACTFKYLFSLCASLCCSQMEMLLLTEHEGGWWGFIHFGRRVISYFSDLNNQMRALILFNLNIQKRAC